MAGSVTGVHKFVYESMLPVLELRLAVLTRVV